MVDAVLAGEGVDRVADLAAVAAGGAVAIVAPASATAVMAPRRSDPRLADVRRYVADRLIDRPARVPGGLAAEVPMRAGSASLGAVVLLADGGGVTPLAVEVLRLAAVSALAALALESGGSHPAAATAALVRALRDRPGSEAAIVLSQAGEAAAGLAHGAIGLCVQQPGAGAAWLAATIAEQFPTAPSLFEDGIVWLLLPARPGDDPARATATAAHRIANRLGVRAAVGLSSFASRPERLHRALHEARLVLELVRGGSAGLDEATDGTWRLLLGTAVADREELLGFVAASIGPAVDHDARLHTDLVGTFEAYLDHGGNMNATAAAIYAHRHTVAARLERLRALTGLDPARPDDRERLGVGIKAQRILAAAAATSEGTPFPG